MCDALPVATVRGMTKMERNVINCGLTGRSGAISLSTVCEHSPDDRAFHL